MYAYICLKKLKSNARSNQKSPVEKTPIKPSLSSNVVDKMIKSSSPFQDPEPQPPRKVNTYNSNLLVYFNIMSFIFLHLYTYML